MNADGAGSTDVVDKEEKAEQDKTTDEEPSRKLRVMSNLPCRLIQPRIILPHLYSALKRRFQ